MQATTARAAAEKRCIESEDIAKRLSVRVGMLQADVDTLSKAWTSLAVELQGRDEVIGQLTGKLQQMYVRISLGIVYAVMYGSLACDVVMGIRPPRM